MKPKRCSKCKKIIRQMNKSGLCHYHQQLKCHNDKVKHSCLICQEPCSGKMQIEIRKGTPSSFCTYHFNRLLGIKDMKDVRKEIKRLKCYH